MFKKGVCLLLSMILVLSITACGHREPYEDESAANNQETEFVDTDGQFDYKTVEWDGPKGYVIVYPDKNTEAKAAAEDLQAFFKETCKAELKVLSDKNKKSDKEILIGKTNRDESNKDIAEAELKVSLEGDKLVFDGGHDVTVDSAVQKFIRLAPKKGEAVTFSVKTDFVSKRDGGYEYVWGDEFETAEIDFSKWDLIPEMVGSGEMEVSSDKETIYTADGRMNLVARRYFNPQAKDTQYRVPASLNSRDKMNFVYGYAEIRARVPFEIGVWPSYWAKTTDSLSGKINPNYVVEFDVFEVFGSDDTIGPCMHRWYNNGYDYYKLHGADATKEDTSLDTAKVYKYSNPTNLDNEYHVYGWEWTPTEHIVYIDGKEYDRIDITKSFDKNPDTSGYHDAMYLIFNNHLYPSDMSGPNHITSNVQCLPAVYSIDWFRLYQKKDTGALYTDTTVNSYPEREE